MTEKGEKILEAALELFVKNGFDGTSTIEIAKKAGVSEALIFKHFKSNAGLLEAIINLLIHKFNNTPSKHLYV